MENNKKKIIPRFELIYPSDDGKEQHLDFSISISADALNNIFKVNDNAIITLSKLWDSNEIQELIHESQTALLNYIEDAEYKCGKLEELEKIRIDFEDEKLFSAFIDQTLKRVLIVRILNDFLLNFDSFYDEKICEILENQNILKESILLNKKNLIDDVKKIAEEYSDFEFGNFDNNEMIN